MVAGKKVRVALDVALTAMIVFEMLIQFTGEFLHEVVGIAFFVSVILHIALSARWIKSTAKSANAGGLTKRRAALAVMGILLALTTVVLAVSSVAISNLLSSTGFVWPIGSYAFWATAHSVSAYALCGLVAIHLAMHWAFMASAFRVPYDPSRRRAISAGVHVVAATGAVALGLAAVNSAFPQAKAIGEDDVEGGVSDAAAGEQPSSIPAAEAEAASGGGQLSGNAAASGSRDSSRKGGSSSRGKRSSEAAGSAGTSSASGPSAAPSSNQGATSGGGAADGVCTLCRKQCSLSAPKCDKPYEAGLL